MVSAPVQQLRSAGPLRLGLGAVGGLVILYAAIRILQDQAHTNPTHLALWLAAGLIIHDGIVAPLTLGVGWLTRFVPARPRPYVQAAMAVAALITAVSIPLLYRQGQSGPGSALLKQNYGRNLLIVLVLIAAVTGAAYAIRISRAPKTGSAARNGDATHSSSANARPADDQESLT